MAHKNISELLRKRRTELALTQRDIAEELGYESPQFISNLERGTCGVPREQIESFSRALGLDKVEIINACIQDYIESFELV